MPQVSAGAHAHDDLARSRAAARRRSRCSNRPTRRLDEGLHDAAAGAATDADCADRRASGFPRPTKRARSGSRPPPPGSSPAAATRLARASREHPARALDAPDGRERRLAGRGVLARRLAEGRRVRLDVEQVVLDLEREADRAPVAVEPREIFVCREGEDAAHGERRADQAAGLALVDRGDELLRGGAARRSPRDPPPGRRSCPSSRSRRRPRRAPAAWRPRRSPRAGIARASRGRASAARRPRGSPSPRRRRRGRSARPAAGRRCRAPGGRRG